MITTSGKPFVIPISGGILLSFRPQEESATHMMVAVDELHALQISHFAANWLGDRAYRFVRNDKSFCHFDAVRLYGLFSAEGAAFFFSAWYCEGKTLNSSLKYLVKTLGLLKPTS